MRVIVFEGIATSGKTTTTNLLASMIESLDKRVLIFDENKTFIPLIEDWTPENNINICEKVICEAMEENPDVAIFDRLYFSHILRTDSNESQFGVVRELLEPLKPTFVLLAVEDSVIGTRIFESMKHRDASWAEFVWKKGETRDEIVDYYKDQQRSFRELFAVTSFDTEVIDTTAKNFDNLAQKLLVDLDLIAQ